MFGYRIDKLLRNGDIWKMYSGDCFFENEEDAINDAILECRLNEVTTGKIFIYKGKDSPTIYNEILVDVK